VLATSALLGRGTRKKSNNDSGGKSPSVNNAGAVEEEQEATTRNGSSNDRNMAGSGADGDGGGGGGGGEGSGGEGSGGEPIMLVVPVRSVDARLQGMLCPFQQVPIGNNLMPTVPMAEELKARKEAEEAKAKALADAAEAAERRRSRFLKFKQTAKTVKLVGGTVAAFKSAHELQVETDFQRSVPKLVSPKVVTDGRDKTYMDWIELRGGELPGPGEYDADGARKKLESSGGGRFNMSMTKSDLEWKIHRANLTPGVGEYAIPDRRVSGGKFNNSKAKSDLEWKMLRASQVGGVDVEIFVGSSRWLID